MIIPQKLQKGDEIRIVAPSASGAILSDATVTHAKERLEQLGFIVTFGKNLFKTNTMHSSSIEERIEDLHDAFRNPRVKAVLAAIGGFNSNELLPYIDYSLIRKNPKIFCGYSDTTAIATAIMTKANVMTYSGPAFSTFAIEKGRHYHEHYFLNCLTNTEPFIVSPSSNWSDDAWYDDQQNRSFEQTKWKVYKEGEASGQILGGNLCTLNLLQGTPYFPKNTDRKILFIEDDHESTPEIFARDFASLLQSVTNVQGIVVGRFQKKSMMTEEKLHFIFDQHPLLKTIPVLYDTDFGHTQSMFTFPLGGTAHFKTAQQSITFWRF